MQVLVYALHTIYVYIYIYIPLWDTLQVLNKEFVWRVEERMSTKIGDGKRNNGWPQRMRKEWDKNTYQRKKRTWQPDTVYNSFNSKQGDTV